MIMMMGCAMVVHGARRAPATSPDHLPVTTISISITHTNTHPFRSYSIYKYCMHPLLSGS